MEMVVSMTVQDKNVCFKERLKNSLNIQKPESFTCDPNTLPVPIAKTMSSGDTRPAATSGETTPAAVMPATVAEPIATLSNAVTIHPNNKGGICHLLLKEAIYLSVPLSCNTCLKTPPAVMINTIIAIPDTASFSHFIAVPIVPPGFNTKYHIAVNTADSRAMVESPKNKIIFLMVKIRSSGRLLPCAIIFSFQMTGSGIIADAITARVINITGRSPMIKLGNAAGNFFCSFISGERKEEFTSTFILFNMVPNAGPATNTTGIAMRIPYINVFPMSVGITLLKTPIIVVGPGCGGKKQ